MADLGGPGRGSSPPRRRAAGSRPSPGSRARWGATNVSVLAADALRPPFGPPSTRCSSTRRAAASARWPATPTSAGGSRRGPRPPRRAAARPARDRRAPWCARAVGSSTRPARSSPRRTRASWPVSRTASRVRERGPAVLGGAVPRGRVRPHRPRPPPRGRLLRRPAPPGELSGGCGNLTARASARAHALSSPKILRLVGRNALLGAALAGDARGERPRHHAGRPLLAGRRGALARRPCPRRRRRPGRRERPRPPDRGTAARPGSCRPSTWWRRSRRREPRSRRTGRCASG